MTKEEFQASSVKRVNEILGERATEIETWIAGLVGLGFSEGIKHAIKSNASKGIITEWSRRLAVMSLALEEIRKFLTCDRDVVVRVSEARVGELLLIVDAALKEVPKGGGG